MARQASDINPDDVFKAPNLGPGDPWARQVMDRVVALEKGYLQTLQQFASMSRTFASSLSQIVDATQSQGAFTVTKEDQTITSSTSAAAGLFATVSVTVPTGALSAVLTVKGVVTVTNDAQISPPENLTLTTQGWYSHLAAGVPWEPGLIGSYTPFSIGTIALPTGATASAVTVGTVTVPVTPGYTLIVGTDSRFSPTASPQGTNNARVFVVGDIQFVYHN